MAMAARMPMIATTIISSIRVNPFLLRSLLNMLVSSFRVWRAALLTYSYRKGRAKTSSPAGGEPHSIPCFCNRYRSDRKEIFNNFAASVRFPPVFSRAFSRWIFSRRSISVSRKTPSSGNDS